MVLNDEKNKSNNNNNDDDDDNVDGDDNDGDDDEDNNNNDIFINIFQAIYKLKVLILKYPIHRKFAKKSLRH